MVRQDIEITFILLLSTFVKWVKIAMTWVSLLEPRLVIEPHHLFVASWIEFVEIDMVKLGKRTTRIG